MLSEREYQTGEHNEVVVPVWLRHSDESGMFWRCAVTGWSLRPCDVGPHLTRLTRELWELVDLYESAKNIVDKFNDMPDGPLGGNFVNGDFLSLKAAVNEINRVRVVYHDDEKKNVRSLVCRLISGLRAVEELINESESVLGLHRNGAPAPWDELRTGGRFECWLGEFDAALKLCDELLPTEQKGGE